MCRELRKGYRGNFFREVLRAVDSSIDNHSNATANVDLVTNTGMIDAMAVSEAGASLHREGRDTDTGTDDDESIDVDDAAIELDSDDGESVGETQERESKTALDWAEKLATASILQDCLSREWMIRRTAHQLAAAYYIDRKSVV